ncbi:hypothetical protein ACFCW2_04785 [Qipengyuania sp. DSG2-2]|uniref:hypothetical protein n=1 Tax=Qipengyuania sp. DGS2-2 TaxID=3349631 RepID=UPI0036D304DD
MSNLLLAASFAVSMILVALGVSQGQVDPKFGQLMLFVLPALAVSMTASGKCCLPFGKARS